MALKYDLNGIFADLEEQVKKTQKQYEEIDETKENESIESPEDAPQTQEVAPATSKTSEDIHGGDEASKEIKNSQNSVVDGENSNKENKNKNTKNTEKNNKGDVLGTGSKQSPNEKKEDFGDKRLYKSNLKTTPEDLQQIVENLFKEKQKKQQSRHHHRRGKLHVAGTKETECDCAHTAQTLRAGHFRLHGSRKGGRECRFLATLQTL